MAFKTSTRIDDPISPLINEPWILAQEPFQVSPRTYYAAGQKWVGCYLIDTGDGLILLDTAMAESLYLLVESVYRLGYTMRDIKKILISHAHIDHCGGAAALQKLTGAKVYMSREDARFLAECPEETMLLADKVHVHYFKPDEFFDDNNPVKLGNISVETLLTPGHTVGCTSFFWEEINPDNGAKYRIAMHGGVGQNTMNDEYYAKSRYLTPDLRDRFFADTEKLKQERVDIALPSHPNQIEILDRAGTYTHTSQPYVDTTVWADFLDERVRQVRELMKEDKQ